MNLGTIFGKAVGIGGGISTGAAKELFGGVLESVLRATSAAAAQGVLRKAMTSEFRKAGNADKFSEFGQAFVRGCNSGNAEQAGDALAAILGEILND